MTQRITLVRIRKAPQETADVNQELQWLGTSLGLFNLRDRDSSCFRVFITFIQKAHHNEPASSDEIAEKLNLSRGTVVHHLSRLMDAGLVLREKEGYVLRETNLAHVVKDIQRDVQEMLVELERVAKEIDERLG
ncbi:ArsR family transcriptional regulator [Candidatus Woesearchaeota archaeon]|nr:ArsR family transcriptional regulator [Candidatus Woesearchaeota archaeon]